MVENQNHLPNLCKNTTGFPGKLHHIKRNGECQELIAVDKFVAWPIVNPSIQKGHSAPNGKRQFERNTGEKSVRLRWSFHFRRIRWLLQNENTETKYKQRLHAAGTVGGRAIESLKNPIIANLGYILCLMRLTIHTVLKRT